jgi:glycosyltransferase involved in cell wall biosynthesis
MSLPSISVIFLSYKQQDYVVAALRAVLEQDLPEFEVIIGDDDSPDETRALIEAELEGYRGKASIILLPPAPNVGVIRNFNRCAALATGDILVAAAGDDVSHPMRLRRIAEFFRDHPGCYAHYSNARVVDATGGVLRPVWYHHRGVLFRQFDPRGFHLYQGVQFCGATGSYRGDVFRKFPPMSGATGGEDAPLVVRSLLLGSAAIDSEILLDWRWHGANMSHGSKPRNIRWPDKLRRAAAWPAGQKVHRRGYLADLAHAERQGLAAPEVVARLRQLVDDAHAQASVKFHCTHPKGRWSSVCAAVRRFWQVSPRGVAWKARFVAKTVAKKLLPGPLRAVVLFDFSKF